MSGHSSCIWLISIRYLNIVLFFLELDYKFANLVAEAVVVGGELLYGEAIEDFSVVNGGHKFIGNGTDHVVEILLDCQCVECHLRG